MGESREINRSKYQKCLQQHKGEADAEYSGTASQHRRLDQNLSHNVRRPGAQSDPYAKLMAPRESARKQKTRDIRACDQEDRRDRAEKYVQGLSKIAANVIEQQSNLNAGRIAILRVLLRETSSYRIHFRSRLRPTGITPTTVASRSPTVMCLPTMSGEEWNSDSQN